MSNSIDIIIMTGNSLRHRYFANKLSAHFNVVWIVSEKKKPLFKSGKEPEDKIVADYEEVRLQREADYFKEYLKFNAGAHNILAIPWGESNSHKVYNRIIKFKPRYIVLFGSSIIRPPLLSSFKDRVVNMHLGLSPYYRGVATNFWPLVYNEPECVGVTVHLATLKVDGGAILGQTRPSLSIDDDIHDITCKSVIEGTELTIRCLKLYDRHLIIPQSQKKTIGGKLFKSSDFNVAALIKMKENFAKGMIVDYLNNKAERLKRYPIVEG